MSGWLPYRLLIADRTCWRETCCLAVKTLPAGAGERLTRYPARAVQQAARTASVAMTTRRDRPRAADGRRSRGLALNRVGSTLAEAPRRGLAATGRDEVAVHGGVADDVRPGAQRVRGGGDGGAHQVPADGGPDDPDARAADNQVAGHRGVHHVAPGAWRHQQV